MAIGSLVGRSFRPPLALLSLALIASALAAQGIRISPPLAQDTGGEVLEARVSADSRWVVFRATQDSEVPGLFSARVDGSARGVRLASPDLFDRLNPDRVFGQYQIVSGNRVVFDDREELFIAPIDGRKAPVRLLPPELERVVRDFVVSADGSRVLVTTGTPNVMFLYALELDGTSQPVPIAGPAEIYDVEFLPDGDVFFRTYNDFFRVPFDASTPPQKLNGSEHSYAHLRYEVVGDRLVYGAQNELGNQLFSVALAGGASVPLSGPVAGRVESWLATPDGSVLVYRADRDTYSLHELFRVPADGSSAAQKLNGLVNRTGDVTTFLLTPDGSRAVFLAGVNGTASRKLQSVPLDGSQPPLVLMGPAPDLESSESIGMAEDGQRVVFRGGGGDLIAVSTVDESSQVLSSDLYSFGPAYGVTPDGLSVVYLERKSEGFSLLRRDVAGDTEPVLLHGPFQVSGNSPNGGIVGFTPDSGHALVRADLDVLGLRELYALALDAAGPLVKLNGPLATKEVREDVRSLFDASGTALFTVRRFSGDYGYEELYAVLPGASQPRQLFPETPPLHRDTVVHGRAIGSGGRVVFLNGVGEDDVKSLFSVPADGSAPAIQLNDPTTTAGGIGRFELSADGEWAVYSDQGEDYSELYAVPIGGGAEVELADGVLSFRVAPAGDRVVFFTDARQLFSMPVDGSAAPVLLATPLPAGSYLSAGDYAIAPTGLHVVLHSDLAGDGVRRLYSVAIDGSAAPLPLTGTPVAGGQIRQGFLLTPDGRAVYLADQETDEVLELFGVPIDGSASPVKLSGTMATGGDIVLPQVGTTTVLLTPDGTRVVYLADALSDETYELFSAPTDGSSGPVRLSGVPVADGDVRIDANLYQPTFRITADGSRVVYRGDLVRDEVAELFSAPIDGGAGDGGAQPIQLSGPLLPGREVLEGFQVSPDGKHAFFVADARTDDVFELFAAPIDRPKEARCISGPLVPGGDVAFRPYTGALPTPTFVVAPDGASVLYLADQIADEAFELFLTRLDPPARGPVRHAPPRR